MIYFEEPVVFTSTKFITMGACEISEKNLFGSCCCYYFITVVYK